jgi:hypothetical protein
MTAALDDDGRVHLLAEPDSGEHAGETQFLTSVGDLGSDYLRRKTHALFRPVRALMVMTDGVADDYFPADPGMARLYADLVLNGVVGVGDGGPTETDAAPADAEVTVDAVGREGPRQVRLRSAAVYAERRGVPAEELVRNSAHLRAVALPGEGTPAERLRDWLDAYQVRGSFDDRTLVVLSREAPR